MFSVFVCLLPLVVVCSPLCTHHIGCSYIEYSGTPFIQTLVIRITNYPAWLGSGKLSRILPKLTCLEINGYRIKYSAVLWLQEHEIRHGQKALDAGAYGK